MWISYQNTMGNKYSVVEAIQKYLDTNDDRELPVIRDLAQMARNSEMEHATKDLPKFKREIGEQPLKRAIFFILKIFLDNYVKKRYI